MSQRIQPPRNERSGTRSIEAAMSFDELWTAHQSAVLGFLKLRTRSTADAADMLHDVYLTLREKTSTFDPSIGSFHQFAGYWARIHLLRYFSRPDRRLVLFSELAARYPDAPHLEDVLAVLASRADPLFEGASKVVEHGETQYRLRVSRALVDVLLPDSPPHQLLAFLLHNVGEGSDPMPLTPREIVAELSDERLEETLTRVVAAYAQTSWRTPDEVRTDFEPLQQAMDKSVGSIVKDSKTRETHSNLLERRLGGTRLRDYFRGESGAQNISHWCLAVERRIISAVNERADLLIEYEAGRQRRTQEKKARQQASKSAAAEAQKQERERAAEEAARHRWLFQAVTGSARPLHELLAVLWAKVAAEAVQGERGRAWSPRRIVLELSEATLASLLDAVQDAYFRVSRLPRAEVRSAFDRLRARLNAAVTQQVAERHPRELKDAIVGDTQLRHYYTTTGRLTDAEGKPAETAVRQYVKEVERWQDSVLKDLCKEVVLARRRGGASEKNQMSIADVLSWFGCPEPQVDPPMQEGKS